MFSFLFVILSPKSIETSEDDSPPKAIRQKPKISKDPEKAKNIGRGDGKAVSDSEIDVGKLEALAHRYKMKINFKDSYVGQNP